MRTASSNGKWVMFLGDRPMEPMEPSYRFQNPYLSDLQYDDQDGVPKLILSPTSSGLNFYPVQAEGGKILLADVLKPPPPSAQALPPQPAPQPSPASAQPTPEGPTPQVTEESPAAPPGPPLPVVALDAGHGGADNGGHSRDGVLEKDLVAQYVARVRSALLATDKYRVVLSRTGDVNVSFEQRALAANLSGAICFLSFHAGDLGTASPRITIFTFQPPTAAAPAAGKRTPTPTFVPWGQVQEARLGQSLQLAACPPAAIRPDQWRGSGPARHRSRSHPAQCQRSRRGHRIGPSGPRCKTPRRLPIPPSSSRSPGPSSRLLPASRREATSP